LTACEVSVTHYDAARSVGRTGGFPRHGGLVMARFTIFAMCSSLK